MADALEHDGRLNRFRCLHGAIPTATPVVVAIGAAMDRVDGFGGRRRPP